MVFQSDPWGTEFSRYEKDGSNLPATFLKTCHGARFCPTGGRGSVAFTLGEGLSVVMPSPNPQNRADTGED